MLRHGFRARGYPPQRTCPTPGMAFAAPSSSRTHWKRSASLPHVARQMATITGGHHGRFLTYERSDASSAALDERFDHEGWTALRNGLWSAFVALFDLAVPPTTPLAAAPAMFLAGVVSVADWIGSIESVFTWDAAGGGNLTTYFARVRAVAREVLRSEHWLTPDFDPQATFEALLSGKQPRPLQSAAVELAAGLDDTSLAIIESPMGEGKTEAAFYLANHWEARGVRGSYIALPTQATANQMHQRVTEFLQARAAGSAVNLVLAHGGAWHQPRLMHANVHGDEAGGLGAVAAGEWFLSRKRALLAPYGVGTVDQALLAVLQVKHVFVRLLGLRRQGGRHRRGARLRHVHDRVTGTPAGVACCARFTGQFFSRRHSHPAAGGACSKPTRRAREGRSPISRTAPTRGSRGRRHGKRGLAMSKRAPGPRARLA